MYKWIMSVLVIAASVLGISVLYQNVSEKQAEMANEKATKNDLKISAVNFKFNEEEYKVKAGEEKTVSFTNKEGLHAMEIVGMDVKLDKNTPSQKVKFDKPGTYEIKCILPCGEGHDKMVSKLIVE